VTETEVKPENVLMYRGWEYGRSIQSAAQIFNSSVTTKSTLDPENAIDAYIDANKARLRVMEEMYRTIENMRKSGMKDIEIRRALKKNGVGDVGSLMRGRFVPLAPASTVKKRVRANGNKLPMSEINELRREFKKIKLGAQPEPEPVSEDLETRTFAPQPTEQSAAALPSSTVPAQAGAAPAPQSAPAPSSQPQDAAGVLPLLGSGLDALKNLQIFQRTQ